MTVMSLIKQMSAQAKMVDGPTKKILLTCNKTKLQNGRVCDGEDQINDSEFKTSQKRKNIKKSFNDITHFAGLA